MTLSEQTTWRTSDGRTFANRHDAEEHQGFLQVRDACLAIWPDSEAALIMAEDLTNASRTALRNLRHALEPFA